MSRENVEVVRGLYEAFDRGAYSTALELIDPEIEVEYLSERGWMAAPVGTYRGHAGLRSLLEAIWGEFEDVRSEVEECVPTGDDVVVAVRFYARGRRSGVEVNVRSGQVWTLRGGKAVRWQLFATPAEALEAVGLSE